MRLMAQEGVMNRWLDHVRQMWRPCCHLYGPLSSLSSVYMHELNKYKATAHKKYTVCCDECFSTLSKYCHCAILTTFWPAYH